MTDRALPPVKLAPSSVNRLRVVYAAYEQAELGNLTATADALARVCSDLGWLRSVDGPFRTWAEAQLETPPK